MLPFGSWKKESSKELRNWDLWGPLMFCLVLATYVNIFFLKYLINLWINRYINLSRNHVCIRMLISLPGSKTNKSILFELTFVVVWVGAGIVAINGKLLGGKM